MLWIMLWRGVEHILYVRGDFYLPVHQLRVPEVSVLGSMSSWSIRVINELP